MRDPDYSEALASMGTFEMDGSGNDIFWSDEFYRLHGLVPKSVEPSSQRRMSMVYPADREKLKEAFEQSYQTGKPYSLEKRIVLPDNSIKWVLSKGEVRIGNDNEHAVRGVMINITAHKLLELEKAELQNKLHIINNERLQRSLTAFQQAISKSSIVSRANRGGIITDINENFVNISGYSREELVGQNHRIINSGYHSKEFWQEMWKTIVRGEIWRAEVKNKARNGQYYWVDTFIMPLLDRNGKVREFLSIRNDITSRKLSEEELRASQQRAEKANLAKSEFLANMSHEIRTPLNGVIGFTDLLLATNLDSTQTQYLALVNQSANSLLDIVNNILDLSKIEAGKIELNPEKTDLKQLCQELIDMISLMAKSNNINLIYNYSDQLPQYVEIDPFRIKQILLNLLANSIKFTKSGEIELTIKPSIKLRLEKPHESAAFYFSVRDTGIGIRKENFKKIFESFSQEDSSVTKKYGGTGLGLSISNSLLKLMKSQLNLHSELDKGSIFYFDLILDFH